MSAPSDEQVYEWIADHYGRHMTKHLLDEHKRLLLKVDPDGNTPVDKGFLPADLDKILQTVQHARACIIAGHEPLDARE